VLGKARTFLGAPLHHDHLFFFGAVCHRPSMFMLFNNTVNTLAQESWLTFVCKTLIRIETEATQREKWLVARVEIMQAHPNC
jgi:hypothetical protein